MQYENIYNLWTDFINDNKYKKYFEDTYIQWINNLDKVKKYIDDNDKRPPSTDKNNEIKTLNHFISSQLQNYKTKKNIMKDEYIYNLWSDFIYNVKYKKYFDDDFILWINKLNEVKKYIDKNNKKPTRTDKNDEIKILGNWISTQIKNYKDKKQIIKNENIYYLWTEFINDSKYKKYF